jgi:hypothetical protein
VYSTPDDQAVRNRETPPNVYDVRRSIIMNDIDDAADDKANSNPYTQTFTNFPYIATPIRN